MVHKEIKQPLVTERFSILIIVWRDPFTRTFEEDKRDVPYGNNNLFGSSCTVGDIYDHGYSSRTACSSKQQRALKMSLLRGCNPLGGSRGTFVPIEAGEQLCGLLIRLFSFTAVYTKPKISKSTIPRKGSNLLRICTDE